MGKKQEKAEKESLRSVVRFLKRIRWPQSRQRTASVLLKETSWPQSTKRNERGEGGRKSKKQRSVLPHI
jgi:hypothetical protein